MSMIAVASASPIYWIAVKNSPIEASCVSPRPICSPGALLRATVFSRGASTATTMARLIAILTQITCAGG